jgi:hypothetical protein
MTFGQNSLIWICPKNVMKEDYLKKFVIEYVLEEEKEGNQRQDGKKTYSQL